jgi:Zn-dependent M16 (insulinase) family peptidase
VEKYAASAESDEEPKTFLAVNWLLAEERFDVETELAFSFLNFLMLGTPAAPLRKALESSGLGEALVGGGLEDELRQPTFTIGLKGVKGDNVAKVEPLVMDTLKQLRKDGFDPEAVEAAVNTIEFSLRENNTGRFPRGLSLMLRSMSTWLYDADPFEPMKYAAVLDTFKAKLAAGEDVFGPLLDTYLLKNTHRVTLELQPDSTLAAAQEAEEKAKIEAFRATLDADGIKQVIDNTKALKVKQETPDSPEKLRCMPALSLSDIPKQAQTTPSAVETTADDATILRHDLFTNDVLYVEALFDMRAVSPTQLPLVPLFCRCLTNMGTQQLDFVELTQKIGRKTGGISVYPSINNVRGEDEALAHIIVKGKTTRDKADDMMDLYTEVLTATNFDDKDRFLQMVLETKANMEARIVGGGHSVAAGRIDAMDSTAGYANELMGGVSYLEYLRVLAMRVEADWDGVKAELEAIRTAVLSRKGALVNMTADEKTMTAADNAVNRFLSSMPAVGGAVQPWSELLALGNEGLVVPTQVNYVGKGANLYKAGYELQGSAYVISKYLGTTWLWVRLPTAPWQNSTLAAANCFCSLPARARSLRTRRPL